MSPLLSSVNIESGERCAALATVTGELSQEFAEIERILLDLPSSIASPLVTGWLAQARAIAAQ